MFGGAIEAQLCTHCRTSAPLMLFMHILVVSIVFCVVYYSPKQNVSCTTVNSHLYKQSKWWCVAIIAGYYAKPGQVNTNWSLARGTEVLFVATSDHLHSHPRSRWNSHRQLFWPCWASSVWNIDDDCWMTGPTRLLPHITIASHWATV